ncbi:MAG: glycosyltransferase [Candidatus Dadabacteria bacterium]|nr:glycosyltransferase [Candidatus Dadabacteria bacterium]
MKEENNNLVKLFNNKAQSAITWYNKNKYYNRDIEKLCKFLIPENSSVLEIGCGIGNLLSCVKPKRGIGVDFSPDMIEIARSLHPDLEFMIADAHKLSTINSKKPYDYIILSNLISYLDDIQTALLEVRRICNENTRVIITYHNYLWEPFLTLAEKIWQRSPQPFNLNWLSDGDIENFLDLAGLEVVIQGKRFLIPKYIPIIGQLFNGYIDKLPIIRNLCLTSYVVAKPIIDRKSWNNKYRVSVLIPAMNEKGNIEDVVKRIPKLGKQTEIIFVEGGSKDGTWQEIERVYSEYKDDYSIIIMQQDGKGKGDAVRKGFDAATGDILMILDADLTVMPEDLKKFYDVIASGKGEFINGSRLVYQMEDHAMRFLNILGNKFFSLLFTWLLDQRFKDTLCGTKVLFKKDYEKLKEGRNYFGEFDPFGDFDLIFGASKLNLKIIELPIRYKERTYGETNISRFKHGVLLLRMCLFAARKIKFI